MSALLKPDFFAREAEIVARDLLGRVLVRTRDGAEERVRVVETEAYIGPHDLACHAARGRTARTEVMFGPAGRAYVYFIYGMYHMLNVVTGRDGDAQAVLIRAAEPLDWLPRSTSGPGRLTRALGIDRSLNGHCLLRPPLYFEDGPRAEEIATSPRIGIDYAGTWRDAPLRFYDAKSPFVSRPPRKRTPQGR